MDMGGNGKNPQKWGGDGKKFIRMGMAYFTMLLCNYMSALVAEQLQCMNGY